MKTKIKKYLLMAISLVLVSATSIIGTIAFLIDSDSKINTFAVGDISVSVTEDTAVIGEGGVVEYDDDGADYTKVMPGDYLKKEVKVANTGTKSAYVAVTVIINNADKINLAIDEFYEGKGYSDDEIQAIYDSVFDGFGMNYNPRPGAAGINDARGVIDGTYGLPNHTLKVDFAKTTKGSTVIGATNWFIAGKEKAGQYWVDGPSAYDGYYTSGMRDYQICYTYYMLLNAGDETILFNGLNIPETFNKEQLAMFDGLNIDIKASAIQADNFNGDAKAAFTALKEEMADGTNDGDVGNVLASPLVDTWDGTVDTAWYNTTDTTFTLTSAEQLAGLAELVDGGNTFAGKTITLAKSIDLLALDENGNRILFEPIGDASNADFSGVFDGNNKTIFNLRQDCNSKHVALFGAVYEGTVKNLILDGAIIENDGSGYAGGIAAYTGASTFENITLRNTTVVNYNHNTAGIAAWCSNNGTTTTFDGINIEDTTTIGSWWGSYDTRVGGIVGAMNTGNYVVIKNSKIACKLDVYNDVTSNYQWYNYRTAGMVVADVRDNHTVNDRTEANPARVTCENVEVIFGDWANYHYCESESYGKPSYAGEGEWKFQRVESGLGYGGVDTSACDHDADETHNELIAFDFLFGARDGKGIYGISSFDGVTVNYNNK